MCPSPGSRIPNPGPSPSVTILTAMAAPFAPGQFVHTPLGKGLVLEVRNRRVLVRVQTRAVLLDARHITAIAGAAASAQRATAPKKAPAHKDTAGAAASSGRIRDALHRHVRGLSAVRTARLDPANAGVTIIVLS